MEKDQKNIKISSKHHEILKEYCDKNGIKIYKVVEKWIDDYLNPSKKIPQQKKDIYGD